MGYSLSSKEISGREILLCRVLTPCLIQRRFGLASCCFGMKNLDVEIELEPLITEFKSIWINLNPPNHPISPCFRSAALTKTVRQAVQTALLKKVTPEGLSLDPHILCVGACTLVLTGVSPGRMHPGRSIPCRPRPVRDLSLQGLTIKSLRVSRISRVTVSIISMPVAPGLHRFGFAIWGLPSLPTSSHIILWRNDTISVTILI